jgi:hypothetical protein
LNGDDDFNAVFGARPPNFAERVMAEAQAKGVVRPTTALAIPAEQPVELTVGGGPYKPYSFMPASVGEGCDVRRWIDGTEIAEGTEFQYRFLMRVGYVGHTQLRLFLPDCVVVIDGQHLTELRQLLTRRRVTFIQQFHPRIWPMPDQGEAIIQRIEITRAEPTR